MLKNSLVEVAPKNRRARMPYKRFSPAGYTFLVTKFESIFRKPDFFNTHGLSGHLQEVDVWLLERYRSSQSYRLVGITKEQSRHMRRICVDAHLCPASVLALASGWHLCFAQNNAAADTRVELTLDASEAKQSLLILQKEQAHQAVTDADWQKLFATLPYQWLKAREAGLQRGFTEEDFRRFLQAPETLARTAEWAQTLAGMERADMTGIGGAYWPGCLRAPSSRHGCFR